MKFLFTGTGRCGTGYVAHLMTQAGHPCGHEEAWGYARFWDKGVRVRNGHRRGERFFTGTRHESSWMAARDAKDHSRFGEVRVIHVTRDPKLVDRSFRVGRGQHLDFKNPYLSRMLEMFPEMDKMADPFQAWIGWVYGQLSYADQWDVSDGAEALANLLQLDPAPFVEAEKKLPKNINSNWAQD